MSQSRDDYEPDPQDINETYTDYVRRYHRNREQAWADSLNAITPIEEAQPILEDSKQIDPYGIGGMSEEDLAEFRAWIEKGFPPRRTEDQ